MPQHGPRNGLESLEGSPLQGSAQGSVVLVAASAWGRPPASLCAEVGRPGDAVPVDTLTGTLGAKGCHICPASILLHAWSQACFPPLASRSRQDLSGSVQPLERHTPGQNGRASCFSSQWHRCQLLGVQPTNSVAGKLPEGLGRCLLPHCTDVYSWAPAFPGSTGSWGLVPLLCMFS